jgi:hypothetical protein
MLTAILITFFALSAVVSTVLIAACALAGRTQEAELRESIPAIAEVKLPAYHLRPSLTVQ